MILLFFSGLKLGHLEFAYQAKHAIILGNVFQNDTITINVTVLASDDNIKNVILSGFKNELRSKNHILITKDNPEFMLCVNTADIKNDNKIIGIAMSSVLTRRIKTEDGRDADEILVNLVNSVDNNAEKIKSKCVEIVSRFDVNYFDKIR